MVGEVFDEPPVEISETEEGLHFSFIGQFRPVCHSRLGHGTGNPGVSPGLPVPLPQQNPYPCYGYGFSRVRVTGFIKN